MFTPDMPWLPLTCLRKYQADVHNLKSAKQEKKEQPIVDQLEQEEL
jgi:hypothetical protein